VNDAARAEKAVRELLLASGADADSDQLRDTPRRVAAAYAEMLAGVGIDQLAPLRVGEAPASGLGVVVFRDVAFRSTCEHHLLPFSGSAHVAYLPGARVVGLGSIVRTLEILSARPQLQESLTDQLADALLTGAEASGSLVVLEARHSCVADRGPLADSSRLVTSAARGALAEGTSRAEAFALLLDRSEDD
jgi:GTP cyclohydrolase I